MSSATFSFYPHLLLAFMDLSVIFYRHSTPFMDKFIQGCEDYFVAGGDELVHL